MSVNDPRTLPSPLKLRRVSLGYTQEQLGLIAGLQSSHISRIENGLHDPQTATKRRLAEALNCKVSEIFPQSSPLAQRRLKANMPLDRLAWYCRIDPVRLKAIESGDVWPTRSEQQDLSVFLGTTVTNLFPEREGEWFA